MVSLIQHPGEGNYDVPVLLICFNRPQYAKLQLASLRRIQPRNVYLAIDGPRNGAADREAVAQVKSAYLNGIDWDCTLKTRLSDINQGCSLGPINAMRWFFSEAREGVILEDDIIPNTDFYMFCKAMLDHYRDDARVMSISGCNLGYEGPADSLIFSKIMNMWGWATWADRLREVDFSITSWAGIKHKTPYLLWKLRRHILDLDLNWARYWRDILDGTVKSDRVTWWDYQFIYHQISNGLLSVFPGANLVRNIGLGEAATHTRQPDHFAARLETGELQWPVRICEKPKADRIFYEEYVKKRWAAYRRPNWKYYLGKFAQRYLHFQ